MQRRSSRARRRMPLFERTVPEPLCLEVQKDAIEALADLLLEVLHGVEQREGASNEPKDHA
jgi:hypothetical protein